MRAFVVLNDGETYSEIIGCSIVICTDAEADKIDTEYCGDIRKVRESFEIGLDNLTTTEEDSE